MKLKVGDKVKIRRWEDMEYEYPSYCLGGIKVTENRVFIPEMRRFCGRFVTISDVLYPPDGTFYEIQEDYGAWEWVSEMFELDSEGRPICYSDASDFVASNKDEQIEEIADCVLGGSAEYRLEVAEHVYSKGYRKPRKGNWILDFTLDGSNFYKCSVCGRQEILLAKENVSEWFPYCHCGSQMTDDPLALKHNEDLMRYNN